MTTSRRSFALTVASLAVLVSIPAAGQRAKRIPRIAFVASFAVPEGTGADPIDPFVRAFVHGLRDLGLVGGRNIIIERRSTERRVDRVPALMQEMRTTSPASARAIRCCTESDCSF